MAEIVACPNCQRKLQAPEEYLGQRVQCPECRQQFTACLQPPSAPAPSARSAQEMPHGRRREDDEDDDYLLKRRIRHHYEPHRDGVILALGLIALVGFFVLGLPAVIGPVAWGLGSSDLREMHAGRMDPRGESRTRAGMICGMIATMFLILGGLFFCLAIATDDGGF